MWEAGNWSKALGLNVDRAPAGVSPSRPLNAWRTETLGLSRKSGYAPSHVYPTENHTNFNIQRHYIDSGIAMKIPYS
jgi:hypothetical protein